MPLFVMVSARVAPVSWYVPGRTTIRSPSDAASRAAWIDWPDVTTVVRARAATTPAKQITIASESFIRGCGRAGTAYRPSAETTSTTARWPGLAWPSQRSLPERIEPFGTIWAWAVLLREASGASHFRRGASADISESLPVACVPALVYERAKPVRQLRKGWGAGGGRAERCAERDGRDETVAR